MRSHTCRTMWPSLGRVSEGIHTLVVRKDIRHCISIFSHHWPSARESYVNEREAIMTDQFPPPTS